MCWTICVTEKFLSRRTQYQSSNSWKKHHFIRFRSHWNRNGVGVNICSKGLVDACRDSIESTLPIPATNPMCQVPMITSLAEEQTLIAQVRIVIINFNSYLRFKTSKPVVKLLYNRGNNKYSYTRYFYSINLSFIYKYMKYSNMN